MESCIAFCRSWLTNKDFALPKFLFNTTLYENIAYGRPNCTEEEVHWAAKQAGAAEFIAEIPEGYQAVVGERGVKLSVGQKQRISIARALLKAPPILILDEATSSVDTVTEKAIQDALAIAAQGRTTILIAHRLSTTDIADRIVVLEEGRLVEEGTQEELLAREGKFNGTVLERSRTNVESPLFVPNLEKLRKDLQSDSRRPCLVLQGHPASWDDGRFREFGRIVDFLRAQGCEFMTPSGYAAKAGPR